MCDPLSVTSSVLAVVGFAAKSCECLCQTLRRYSEAPEDLQRHLTAVQALKSTFDDIARLNKDAPVGIPLTLEFTDRLRACILDLQAIEELAQSFHAQLKQTKAHRRIWARLRLSLLDQKHILKSHLSRIESYHRTFLLDLLVLNIRSGLILRDEGLTHDMNGRPPDDHPDQAIPFLTCHCSSQQTSDYRSENLSLRSRLWKYLETDLLQICVWLGPVTASRWCNSRSLDTEEMRLRRGHGIAFASTLYRLCPFRLELVVLFLYKWSGPGMNFSLCWNIFWPRIVEYGTRVVDLALCGDVDGLKEEFSKGHSSPFDVLPRGVTLLHLAASRGHLDMVTFLLQNGCRVNSTDNFGETPLHLAITLSKSYDTCRVLLEHGANLWNCNAEGQTPLHTFPNQVSNRIFHCYGSLLDVSACDDGGMTLLHYMAWSSKTSLKMFRRYHKRGDVGLEMVDVEGRSLLHLAAQRGNVPVIEYLLDLNQGCNTKLRDRRGRTVLHYGVENKRAPQTLAILVSHGSDLWDRDCDGRSVLHHAAKFGNIPAIETLLALGMAYELCVADHTGMTPLQIIASHSNHTVRTSLAGIESRLVRTPSASLLSNTLQVNPRSGHRRVKGYCWVFTQTLPYYRWGWAVPRIYYQMIGFIVIVTYLWILVTSLS